MSASQLQPSDCKNEFWCGAKKDATIDAGFGPGEWFAYTDERDDGNSYWTWPAADWEGIVSACNGICGVSTLGPAYMYPYMGFGFFLNENHDAVDITEWGGICVTYSTDTKMRIGLHPNEEGQAAMEYNDFRVALTPGKNITKNFAWSDFKQDIGWGKAYDRDLLLTQIVELRFLLQHFEDRKIRNLQLEFPPTKEKSAHLCGLLLYPNLLEHLFLRNQFNFSIF